MKREARQAADFYVRCENKKIMRKPSLGIIIFGIVFILCGFQCLRGVIAYFAYRATAPYIYKSLTVKSNEMEEFLKEKVKDNPIKVKKVQEKFELIKQDIKIYKEKYIETKMVPIPTLIFVVISLSASGIFLFTGVSIIQLRHSARKWISVSFLAGFIWVVLYFWNAGSTVSFIMRFADRFATIFAYLNEKTLSELPSISGFEKIMLSPLNKRIIFVFFAIYLAFMSITSIFFSRPKIKEQFK
jgi:hypothetical protein